MPPRPVTNPACHFVTNSVAGASSQIPLTVSEVAPVRPRLLPRLNTSHPSRVGPAPSRIPVYQEIPLDPAADVQVSVMYQRPVKKVLAPSLRSVGLALAKGNWQSIAASVMKTDQLRSLIIQLVAKEVDGECKRLCSLSGFKSVLRSTKPKDLAQLSWSVIIQEWRREAPVMCSILFAIVGGPHERNVKKARTIEQLYPPVCTAGAILLKERNQCMSALQHLIGIILFHGDVHKMAQIRLSHLEVTTHPDTTLKKMDELGIDYNAPVMEWKKEIEAAMERQGDSVAEAGDLPSYQMIGDNVDVHQKTSHMTLAKRGKEHHWFHLYAVKNRISGNHLPNDKAIANVATLPFTTWLPSVEDCVQLRNEIIMLISRVVVRYIPAFQFLKGAVPDHLVHQYSREMAKVSQIVPLGVLSKCESTTEDMIDIVAHIQQYTPRTSGGKFQPLLFGGDQVTRERATGAQDAKAQSDDPMGRLQGVIPKVEDWHALVCFYQVIWNTLYKEGSLMEKGTLKQIQNLINRTNVPKVVKNDFNAARDFLNAVTDSHILAASLVFFGMEKIQDKPGKHEYPDTLPSASLEEKQQYLRKAIGAFVDGFVLNFIRNAPSDLSAATVNPDEGRGDQMKKDDHVFNYACAVVGLGLMARNFEDASREGDGNRLLRMWKFFLLHFKADGRTKYSLEAFRLIAQVNALLTPRLAHQLTWNRTCKLKTGEGHNIPLDLHNEHLNRVFKDDINTFRANITEHSIQRSSRSLGPLQEVLKNFDKEVGLHQPSGKHPAPEPSEDMQMIMKVLLQENVFNATPGRSHATFPHISSDPFLKVKQKHKELHAWFKRKRKEFSIIQAMEQSQY